MNPLGAGDPLRLGPYRLLGVLGEGGMGKVYIGQGADGTMAAVKVLHPELGNDTHVAQRFVREAHAAQAVRSKGVAAVLGAQTEGGRPWIAAEFLAGPTLQEAIDTYGPFDRAAVRALAVSAARTLVDIHAAGLIHRDLKPANIVLTSGGPRVIDFGIARPEHGLTLTTTGQIPATPGYGAPEQVLGQRVTPSADVFSLGAVLVYAGTGRPAYTGPHVAALQYAVVHGEPQLQGLDDGLRDLIAPCLAKSPAARPTPAQLVAAFAAPRGADRVWKRGAVADAIKEREEQVKRLNRPFTGTTATVGRRRLVTGMAAGGALLVAGGAGTGWWLHARSTAAENRDLFSVPPARRTPVAPLQKLDPSEDWLGQNPKVLWSAGVVDLDTPRLLPVRDVIVFGHTAGGIVGYDVKSGKPRWKAPAVRTKSGYLSLSDRLIAAADAGGTLRTFVAATGEPKWTADADAATLLAADEQAVYLVTKDHRLRSVGRSDANVRWTAQVPAAFRNKLRSPAVAGHGRLVMGTTDGNVLAVDTSTGRRAWDRQQHELTPVHPVLRGDTVYLNGRSLSAAKVRDGATVWSVRNTAYQTNPRLWWGPPTVAGDAIYAMNAGEPVKVSARDGGVLWHSGEAGDSASPVVVQGGGAWWWDTAGMENIYVYAVRQDNGKGAWVYQTAYPEDRQMAADGNRVFLMSDHSLRALSVF